MEQSQKRRISERITDRLKSLGQRYFVNDNVEIAIEEDELQELEIELTQDFERVLRTLLIDVDNDPNSKETAHRLAKMYLHETFEGRFYPEPKVTAFPNEGEDAYDGLLVTAAKINSICSHHHKDVVGTCYIGILPNGKVLGLSKYIRLAKFHARRGTLQEELTKRIAQVISEKTECPDVAVYIEATHGCVSCRGVNQEDSLTQTATLLGAFKSDPSVKKEFYDNIKLRRGNVQ